MNTPGSLFLLFISLYLLSGCGRDGGQNQQIDREAIKKEMEQREIKRLLPADLVEGAYQRGDLLAAKAEKLILQDQQSFSSLLDSQALNAVDSLAQAEDVQIRWVDQANDSVRLDNKEQQLWEAYQYNVENSLPLDDNVQRLGDEEYLYTKPLLLNAHLGKKLNGRVADTAAFLGMWSIRITKKSLIRSMDAP